MSSDDQKHNFCTGYVKMIFNQWDKDNSGVLDRQELKKWLQQELKDKPLSSASSKDSKTLSKEQTPIEMAEWIDGNYINTALRTM